jgi:hypothetical protein
MRNATVLLIASIVLVWSGGCEMPRTQGFEAEVEVTEESTQAPVESALLVRILKESEPVAASAFAPPTSKRWTHTVDILPVRSGTRVTQEPLDRVRYVDLMHSEVNDLRFEYSLWAPDHAGRVLTPEQVRAGKLSIRSASSLESRRELWRMCEYFDREILPYLPADAPHRRALLTIVRDQLTELRRGGMGSLGVAGRLRRVEAALGETLNPIAEAAN